MSALLPWLAACVASLVAAVVLWPLRQSTAAGPRRHAGFAMTCLSAGAAVACLYLLIGTPQAAAPRDSAPGDAAQPLREGIAALERSLADDPQRADGWALLGRSRAALGQADAAAAAFTRAVQLAPDDAGLLVEAAQARAQARPDKQFDDTALRWLQHALSVQPEAERAAWLLGIAMRQRGRDAEAVAVWSTLLPRLQPPAAAALREQIALAAVSSGPTPAAPSAAGIPDAANDLQVSVTLPAGMETSRWPAQAAVFVIARAPQGPPMPVAVRRLPLTALPATVTLTDRDSPMPTGPLSAHAEVEVQVRVSREGSATRGEDDLQSTPVRVTLPHRRVLTVSWPDTAGS